MFKDSKPIWVNTDNNEMNGFYAFHFPFENDGGRVLSVRIAVCDAYRIYCNGKFVASGPARCGEGYFRQDSIQCTDSLRRGKNTLTVIAAGYNVNCFEYLCQEPFVWLEAELDGQIVARTNETALVFKVIDHEQFTQRYSFQRTFTEVWHLNDELERIIEGTGGQKEVKVITREPKKILFRKSPYPHYRCKEGFLIGGGEMSLDKRDFVKKDISGMPFLEPREFFHAYPTHLLSSNLYHDICCTRTKKRFENTVGNILSQGKYFLYDFSIDLCGYIGLEIKASEDSVLYVFFDEILTEDDIDCLRLGCLNCIKLQVAKGNRKFLSFEPYTFRYAKIFCAEGKVEIEKFYASEVADPRTEKVFFRCEENGLNKIFSAAVNSYRFNAVDILMDCPSRERAGWLCDSFFSGAVEHFLTGKNLIEHDYLENFLLNKAERFIPEKMLPMCYPALHTDSAFIPTWAMWFVLELSQYCQRNGEEFIQRAKNKVYDLISYFSKFENEDGLLEDLPGWVFIEWSKAAEFTDGVNYCVNMLYSLMLRTVAQLYGDDILKEKAEKIAAFIRIQSYDGQFFTDHAVRESGKLVFIKDKTEVCQYYAFFTGVATPQEFPQLFKVLTEDFGPQRRVTNKFPQVWFANAFIGNYLRMIILEQNCLYEQLLREINGYFLYMADKTLTLWENDTDFASCNHGFASYILVCLVRCLTGYEGIDLQGQPKFRQAYVKNIDTDLILPIADDKIISISVKQGNREFKIKDKNKYAEI